MRRTIVVVLALVIGAGMMAIAPLSTGADEATPAAAGPGEGWQLHIDTKLHFPGDPEAIAHHRCKGVAGGMFECLIFPSDDPDATLVAVEVIVDAATYDRFDAAEQELWHYHKTEIPRVEATLPDVPADQAAEIAKSLEETYGKLYILWDPSVSDLPTGQPIATGYLGDEGTPAP